MNWDNDVNKLNLEAIPEEVKKDAFKLIDEINSTWDVFQTNMKALKGKRIPRNGLSKYKKVIKYTMLVVRSDVTGGTKYSIVEPSLTYVTLTTTVPLDGYWWQLVQSWQMTA